MITFSISEVPPGKLYEPLEAISSVHSLLNKPVEAMHCPVDTLVSCDTTHAFVKAAHDAFYDHHPMVIRPDDIWFCIAQGFATHVGQNSEKLRSKFVKHDGKKKLVVSRTDFFLGQKNPWHEVFSAFSDQIGQQVGEIKDLLTARFSTTTITEAAAYDICLMDTFQCYFDYEVRAGCGIPAFTLLGTADDWASMIPRVAQIAEYGLETWVLALEGVLKKIAETAAGNVDKEFWKSFFRYQSGSGPAELTGWIVTLFPYLTVDWNTKALGPNEYLKNWREAHELASRRTGFLRFNDVKGPSIGSIPQGLVSAPVHLLDISTGAEHDLRFIAGMFGVGQDTATGALSVIFGWAIVYDVLMPTSEEPVNLSIDFDATDIQVILRKPRKA